MTTENREIRHLDLEPIHEELGAVWTEQHGWRLPEHYGHPDEEWEAARTGCALFDRSHHDMVEISGEDAPAYLQRVLTQDLKDLQPEQQTLAAATNPKGRFVAWGWLRRTDATTFLWMVEPGRGGAAAAWLERYALGDRVEIQDRSEALGLLALAGARADELSGRPADGALVVPGAWGGQRWVVAPVPVLSEVWGLLVQGGARPAGQRVWNLLRVHFGWPAWDAEIREENTPWDVGLERAVSLEKGCYTGQESLNRLRTYGGIRLALARVEFPEGPPPGAGDELESEQGGVAGTLTTVVEDPAGGVKALALAHREGLEGPSAVSSGDRTGELHRVDDPGRA